MKFEAGLNGRPDTEIAFQGYLKKEQQRKVINLPPKEHAYTPMLLAEHFSTNGEGRGTLICMTTNPRT